MRQFIACLPRFSCTAATPKTDDLVQSGGTDSSGPLWSEVSSLLDAGLADNDVGVQGMMLVIYDSQTDEEL